MGGITLASSASVPIVPLMMLKKSMPARRGRGGDRCASVGLEAAAGASSSNDMRDADHEVGADSRAHRRDHLEREPHAVLEEPP